jgi:hypothetical protein
MFGGLAAKLVLLVLALATAAVGLSLVTREAGPPAEQELALRPLPAPPAPAPAAEPSVAVALSDPVPAAEPEPAPQVALSDQASVPASPDREPAASVELRSVPAIADTVPAPAVVEAEPTAVAAPAASAEGDPAATSGVDPVAGLAERALRLRPREATLPRSAAAPGRSPDSEPSPAALAPPGRDGPKVDASTVPPPAAAAPPPVASDDVTRAGPRAAGVAIEIGAPPPAKSEEESSSTRSAAHPAIAAEVGGIGRDDAKEPPPPPVAAARDPGATLADRSATGLDPLPEIDSPAAAAAPIPALPEPEPEPSSLAEVAPTGVAPADVEEKAVEVAAGIEAESAAPAPVALPSGPVRSDEDLARVEALVGQLALALGGDAGGALAAPERTLLQPLVAPPRLPTSLREQLMFDVVRIAADGSAVIAGRAWPGALIELRLDGQAIERVRADRRGEWVATPDRQIGARSQELSLAASDDDGRMIESDQVVLLAAPGASAAVAEGQEGVTAPLAVLLPRASGAPARLLQAPGGLRGGGDLELQAIDYDERGQVRLLGRATPGSTLRIFVDARALLEVAADAEGSWVAALDQQVRPGDYALRVDQIGGGRTVARIDTPFRREGVLPRAEPQVDFVIVQPGNSLWRIARRLLGDGRHYRLIHAVNLGQIGDPDLIFPGQVFRIPAPG